MKLASSFAEPKFFSFRKNKPLQKQYLHGAYFFDILNTIIAKKWIFSPCEYPS